MDRKIIKAFQFDVCHWLYIIPDIMYCTLHMRLSEKSSISFLLVLYVFYMKVLKQYVNLTSLYIHLPDKNASTDIDFDTFWVLIYFTIC